METNDRPGIRAVAGTFRRRRRSVALGAGILLLATLQPVSAVNAPDVPPLFGGIQVNEPDHDRWAAALVDAGLDTVQVTLYARHQAWDGAELYWDREAPWVVSEIRAAHRAGLRTVLVMRVALEHGLPENRHLWHGMIWPRDELLGDWADRYREFVLWGAGIAAREDVSMFVVGNELSSLTSTRSIEAVPDLHAYFLDPGRVAAVRDRLVQCAESVQAAGAADDLRQLDGGRYATLEAMLRAEETVRRGWARTVLGGSGDDLAAHNARRARLDAFWRDLIDRVRQQYSGPLSYGANFDQYGEVGFWQALDAVSLNAYFPLSRYGQGAAERLTTMERAWGQVAASAAEVAGGLPVVLLELGWTRRLGSTVRPYSYDRVEVLETADRDDGLACVHWATQPQDARERVAAMQALANVVASGGFPALRGLLLWKLTTRPEHRLIEPFAAVLQPGAPYSPIGWPALAAAEVDALDRAYIGLAAAIADSAGGGVASWNQEAQTAPPDRTDPAQPGERGR